MSIAEKIREKSAKAVLYVKIRKLFSEKSEFKKIHPELCALWRNKFYQMVRYGSERAYSIAEEFVHVQLKKEKEHRVEEDDIYAPVLICVIKNDIVRIPGFLAHYRNLGIKNFVFLDNMSTDGTREYLCGQKDTTVFVCAHEYRSERRVAWINRMIAEIGDDRWYLVVDSDEFVSYVGCEEHKIRELSCMAMEKGITRIEGFMVDMYSRNGLFQMENGVDFRSEYCYFDKDTYTITNLQRGKLIRGGPRTRMFEKQMQLSKFPLFYFAKEDIVPSAHYMMPFEKNISAPVYLAILHYKFMDNSDYDKLREAVEKGIYSNNSEDYKKYWSVVSENGGISFYDEKHSVKYSEESLRKLDLLETPF